MIRTSRSYDKLIGAWSANPRYISSCGGARSGKTFSILQALIWVVTMKDKRPTINSVVSETLPHLKKGAIRDFQIIMQGMNLWHEDQWSRSDNIYTFANGSIIEFFSADSPAKVHGPARDRLFINEAQNVPYETARQLFVRTRGIIILDYNPTHSFWLNEEIEPRENCLCIHSTFLDNAFLSQAQKDEIEANRSDANWWRVYGEGKIGQLDGVIYEFEQIDAMPEVGSKREVYGMDYGYTNDPTTLIRCLIDTGKREIYLDELIYETHLLNQDIARRMEDLGVPKRSVPIFADCAEPKTNDEIKSYGWNIQPSYKGTKKAEQIQMIKGYKIFVTKRSLNMIKEMRGYVWDKDRDGKRLNEPIGIMDHAMDAFRYGVFTYVNQYRNIGHYSVSVR